MPRSRTSPQLPRTMTASPQGTKLTGPTSARDRVIARRTAAGIGAPPDAPCPKGVGAGHRVVEHKDAWEPAPTVPGVAAIVAAAAGQVLAQHRRIDRRLPIQRAGIGPWGRRWPRRLVLVRAVQPVTVMTVGERRRR